MGSTPARHHVQNLTSHNIYVKYDKYDIVKTQSSGSAELTGSSGLPNLKEGMSGGIKASGSNSWTIKDRPSGFNLIKPNNTDEHVSDSGACLSVIVLKEGNGYLVINNQQLEVDRSYGLNSDELFKKKHNSDTKDKQTCNWDFDNPV